VRLIGRVLRVLVVLLIVAVLLAGVALGVVVQRGFPQRTGTATLSGLSGDVEVVRDASGIPQVYASTPADLFAAEGWLHASERMWQMEIWRRLGAGRLAELFGRAEVKSDAFVRTLGWRQAAARDLAAADPATRQALDAYASGVNAWLSTHRMGSLPFVVTGLLGAGGGLAGYTPEPWTALDTLTWAKVEAWSLGGNMDTEVFNALLAGRVDAQAVDELTPPLSRPGWPVIVPTGAPGSGGAGAAGSAGATASEDATASAGAVGTAAATPDGAGTTGATAPAALATAGSSTTGPATTALLDIAGLGDQVAAAAGFASAGQAGPAGLGSNDWVVSGAHTASGHPMLANDPHLGVMMPSIWYMIGLHCRPVTVACPYDVAGVSFPGAPGVILGHNARIAWGFTNVNPDVEDLFMEKPDPSDPTRYLYEGKSLPFTTRTETIRVAGAPDVTLTVRSTVHGPVVSDVEDVLKPAALGGGGLGQPGVLYALRWTATAEVQRTFESVLALDRATDWTSFRDALRTWDAPSQNVVYADVDGHIGYQMPGLVPMRKAGNGSAPVPGWDGSHDWTGYVPFGELPYLYDPPSGMIATANNAAVDTKFPHFIGQDWSPGYRAERILQLLAATPKLTQADMRRIQGDTLVLQAQPFQAALVASPVAPITADGRTVLERVRAWDDTCGTESVGCAAYHVFAYHLLRDVFDPRLAASGKEGLARLFVGTERSAEVLIQLLGQPDSRWWDDPATPARETRDQVLTQALDQAGADLRSAFGDPSGWTWGQLHTVTFREPSLGESGIGPLEAAFDRGPYPVAGAPEAVDQSYFDLSRAYPDPYADKPQPAPGNDASGMRTLFEMVAGPSYRFVIDMGDLDGATIMQTTGQSGVPYDAHYGDLIADWLANRDVALPFTRAVVEASAAQRMTLVP
jgi:penicillin amidase